MTLTTPITHEDELARFLRLMHLDGARTVSQWRLPNSDCKFDEEASARRFEAEIDSSFPLFIGAIKNLAARQD